MWKKGLDWKAYRRVKINQNAEAFDADHGSPAYEPGELKVLQALPPLKLVAVAEDWCPDVYHTLGTWARLVEELGWEMRIFARDENPDVMARYLWLREKLRIPVYAFHDEDLRPIVWWSGRSAVAQSAVDEIPQGKSYADATEAEQKRLREVFDGRYRSEFRRANFREIFEVLRRIFHQPSVRLTRVGNGDHD
jgi:hypothetical protein